MEPFKQTLQQKVQYGVFLTSVTWPGLIPILAGQGYDFVVIDTEHGNYDYAQMQALALIARLNGLHPIVRVAGKHYTLVARALDMGADSIMLPTVETAQEVEDLVRWARFPPQGRRGAGNSAFVLAPDKPRFIQETNQNGLVVIQIETRAGVENLDAILHVPGLDAVFIGPLDLSLSLGIPGDFQHPRHVQAVEQVIQKSKATGKAVGILSAPQQAPFYAQMGAHLLAIGLDVTFFQAAESAITQAKK